MICIQDYENPGYRPSSVWGGCNWLDCFFGLIIVIGVDSIKTNLNFPTTPSRRRSGSRADSIYLQSYSSAIL